MTGRAGPFTFGALNIRAGDAPDAGARATSFTVLRARRDLLRRSSVGAMFTGRSVATDGRGQNTALRRRRRLRVLRRPDHQHALGPDAQRGPDRRRDELSGGTSTTPATATACSLEHLLVGDAFNPEVGFVRRRDMRRSFAEFRFSPRPRAIRLGAPLRLDRLVRLRREPRRAGRDARDARVVRLRARQQRRAHGRGGCGRTSSCPGPSPSRGR